MSTYTVTAVIAGQRYIVGHYLTNTAREALRAAWDDLQAMIALQATRDEQTGLPYFHQAQGMNRDDLKPIQF